MSHDPHAIPHVPPQTWRQGLVGIDLSLESVPLLPQVIVLILVLRQLIKTLSQGLLLLPQVLLVLLPLLPVLKRVE